MGQTIEQLYELWQTQLAAYEHGLETTNTACVAAKKAGREDWLAVESAVSNWIADPWDTAMLETEKKIFAMEAQCMADMAIKARLAQIPHPDPEAVKASILVDTDRILGNKSAGG